jgi:hypothetical protein
MMLRGGLIAVLAALTLSALVVSCGGSGGSGSGSGSIGGSSDPGAAVAACEARLPQLNTTGLASNEASIVVDKGPCAYNTSTGTASTIGSVNIAFTSVTVCIPGTSTCQTIDHIMVDTGSSGLRIMSSTLNSNMSLPPVTNAGEPLIECGQFADGYTWGSVRTANVSIGGPPNASGFFTGETANNVNVQVIGDASAYTTPGACSGTGNALNDVASFGANGILGVGLFVNDCSTTTACIEADLLSPLYYECTANSGCASYDAAVTQQVSNPVASFAADNTGEVMNLPAVTVASGEQNVYGTLVFLDVSAGTTDISTSPTQIYFADGYGDFYSAITSANDGYTATATICSNSFIDSGSNGFFIPTSSVNIPFDPNPTPNIGWFTPSGTVNLTAGISSANTTTIPGTPQTTIAFSIANADTVLFPANGGANTAFNNLGGPSGGTCDTTVSGSQPANTSTTGIDWGLPFFFGRPIYVALETTQLTVSPNTYFGPFWAF